MKVVFFATDKQSPVKEFIIRCDQKQRSKISRQIKYLIEFGLVKEVLNLKKLSGTKLWEIRILGKDNIRLICVNFNQQIVILHAFFKKTQKIPRKEFNIAFTRYKMLLDI